MSAAAIVRVLITACPPYLRRLSSFKSPPEWQIDLLGHGLGAAASGLEAPAAHGVGGRSVEIRMAGGFLDDDVRHAAVSGDEHTQERRALDLTITRTPRIARPVLIPEARDCLLCEPLDGRGAPAWPKRRRRRTIAAVSRRASRSAGVGRGHGTGERA